MPCVLSLSVALRHDSAARPGFAAAQLAVGSAVWPRFVILMA